MTFKLLMQQTGQHAHEIALSQNNNTTFVSAMPGSRFSIEKQAGDIQNMTRNGEQLVINSADGKSIVIDHFFGPANKDMKSLTMNDVGTGHKEYVLGDEHIYANGQPVVSYPPEQLRQMVSGQEYYSHQAGEAAAAGTGEQEGKSEVDPLWVALGLGGVALIAGTIALLANNDDDDDDHHSDSNGGGGDDDNGGDTPVPPDPDANKGYAHAVTMDVSNGSSLHGTTDTPNAKIMIDTNGDGKPDYTATSDAKGSWSVPSCEPHLADNQSVTAWVVDENGAKNQTSITVDFHAPDVVSLDVTTDLTALSGVTEANAVVSLDVDGDGKADYSIKADAEGKYSFTLVDQVLIPGTSVLTITDTAGNSTTVHLPLNAAPTILGISDTPDGTIEMTNSTLSTSPTVHGMGEPGSEIDVVDSNGNVVATTQVGADGQWQITLDNLAQGSNTFSAVTHASAEATSSCDNQTSAITVNYISGQGNLNVITPDDVIHTVETDNGINTTQSITRAMPGGGYLIAWAQPESAGSEYYDIKINIYDDKGQVVNTLTVGQENTMDGYTTTDGLQGLNNFDVSVSPVDGSITVFYAEGTPGDLGYTGTTAVYERFTADGTPITDGPQTVVATEDQGGLNGLLDSILGQHIADAINGAVDVVWNAIDKVIQPIGEIFGVDIDGLEKTLVDGLSDRLASLLYGSGTFGANIIQMDDGSVVFVGSRYSEGLDSGTLIDRLDISGFIHDFCDDLGMSSIGDFLCKVLVEPIENVVDSILEWVDISTGSAGSLVWGVEFAPDENGNLVQTTDFQYDQVRNIVSGLDENGFISGSDHNGTINQIAQWIFGTNGDSVGASIGLDGTQCGENTYAVIWQSMGKNAEMSDTTTPEIKITLVDATTGKHITSDVVLSHSGLDPKIVTLDDGSLVATYVSLNPQDHGDIYAQHLSVSNGQFIALGNPQCVNTVTEGTQGLIDGTFKEAYDVSALDNGGFIVTWTSTAADGKEHLEAQLFDMDCVKVGSEMQIDSGHGNAINDSSVTALDDGGYVVNWSESNLTDNTSTVMYAIYNDDGSLRTSGAESATPDNGSEYHLAPETTTFTGSDGSDVIDAHLASATVNGGNGDDRIMVDSNTIAHVDGGAGNDTVVIANDGNVNSDALAKFSHIETIDLNASNGANTLTLSIDDVLKTTSGGDKLFITGGANDTVDLDQEKWTMTATGCKDGQSYNLYTYDDDHHTQVWVQNNMQIA